MRNVTTTSRVWFRVYLSIYNIGDYYRHVVAGETRIILVGQDLVSLIDLQVPYLSYHCAATKRYLCYGIYNAQVVVEGLIALAKPRHQSSAGDRRNS